MNSRNFVPIVLLLAGLTGCATTAAPAAPAPADITITLTPEQAADCKKEDCYVVPESKLRAFAAAAWKAGEEAGKKWL